jgi:hypothetical protein
MPFDTIRRCTRTTLHLHHQMTGRTFGRISPVGDDKSRDQDQGEATATHGDLPSCHQNVTKAGFPPCPFFDANRNAFRLFLSFFDPLECIFFQCLDNEARFTHFHGWRSLGWSWRLHPGLLFALNLPRCSGPASADALRSKADMGWIDSLQTKLQTNCTAQNGIRQYKAS